LFIFFTCIKKTNQQRSGERKCSRSRGSLAANFPVLLKMTGRCETRHAVGMAQTVLALFPVIFVGKYTTADD
jgi:hypothetical protein